MRKKRRKRTDKFPQPESQPDWMDQNSELMPDTGEFYLENEDYLDSSNFNPLNESDDSDNDLSEKEVIVTLQLTTFVDY
jgi:hypothetical protein